MNNLLKNKINNIVRNASTHKHTFHLVTPSPWPILTSFAALILTVGAVMYFQGYKFGGLLTTLGLILVVLYKFFWYKDVVREGTFLGDHTKAVQKGLRLGMLLFIVSEVMFFFAFFWAFFHSSLAPTIEIYGTWPPLGIDKLVLDFWKIPLLNTLILLLSGATITWAHDAIIKGDYFGSVYALIYTLILAVLFLAFQAYEYCEAEFTIADSVYGSTFFMATGFHGFHVFVGTCFIFICFLRHISAHFSKYHHFGFEAAAWYWHFVDVVWLFLVAVVYIWGNTPFNLDLDSFDLNFRELGNALYPKDWWEWYHDPASPWYRGTSAYGNDNLSHAKIINEWYGHYPVNLGYDNTKY